MRHLRQLAALLSINVGTIMQRWTLLGTIVVGVACAVGVLVSLLAVGAGARREAMGNVRDDRVSLLSVGAPGPMQSSIAKDVVPLISDLPGIRRSKAGRPTVLTQALIFTEARKKIDGAPLGFAVSGEGRAFLEDVPEFHLTSGRLFKPGLHELVASDKCVRQLRGFEVGARRSLPGGGTWGIVGNFVLGHSDGRCVVFADADTLISAFGRDNYNTISVMLDSPSSFDTLAGAIKANPSLKLELRHERDLVEVGMQQFTGLLNFVTYFIGAIMFLAATLGAANSLYAVVDSQRPEIATLRAIGFGNGPIIASILIGSMALALPSALLGVTIAWLLFDNFVASPFGISFRLAVTLPIAGIGVGWALAMGLVGGLLPALRAARIPVTVALRTI